MSLLICGVKASHDGGVAVIEDGRLTFSVEMEKLANGRRYSPLGDLRQVERILFGRGHRARRRRPFRGQRLMDTWGGRQHRDRRPAGGHRGRAETGPRALGNRSILAPATSASMKDRLHEIKDRAPYRPVAPLSLSSRAAEVVTPGCDDRYMLFEHRVRPEWRDRVPAVVHLDGTARLQTIDERSGSASARRILAVYEHFGGIPILRNTSANLNDRGFFPDVASAAEWGRTRYIWSDGLCSRTPHRRAAADEPSPAGRNMYGVLGSGSRLGGLGRVGAQPADHTVYRGAPAAGGGRRPGGRIWHNRAYSIGPDDRTLHTASLDFDAAVWEIWPYLAAAATVVACPDEDRVVADFAAEQLADQRCTIAFLATPLAEEVIRLAPGLPELRFLLTGGDTLRLPAPVTGPWRLVNHYGPTVTTVVTTAHTVVDVTAGAIPPIGRAIHGVRIVLLGADLRPVRAGTEGEIFVGGRGLALGYLGDPELTAARFVAVPGRSGRWYRTGDLAVSESGVLTFRGRVDLEQLKVRGVRIEAAEIEAALMACPGVDVAAVTMLGTGADGLLVAAVATARPPVLAQLRAFLAARLPTAAIPNCFVFVDRLPLTGNGNGKIDRRLVMQLASASNPDEIESERVWCAR
ncbi:carbamoyltransferase C-terminal domain-containing protein [Nocardiopsis sp. NPDC006198]|uniref:carbamoyltransferase C-terminal domain-containing protein n=1 Tax=Nocardiopsis sp. NPDC006198 TaxID=3154472 RepID=UPI0033AA5FCA